MHTARIAFLVPLLVLSGKTFAASSVFETMEQCLSAIKAGQVEGYEPKTDAPFKSQPGWEKKTVPTGGACLGGAYVIEDGLPKKGRVVFVKEGFTYWKHTSGSFRMDKCSNPFTAINFPSDPPAQPAPPEPAASTPTGTCEGTGCGDVTRTQVITHIVREQVICQRADGSQFAPKGEKCEFPPVDARVSMAVSATAACGQSCAPTVSIQGHKARADGRCVFRLEEAGTMRYVRFDTAKGGSGKRLTTALVADEKGEWVTTNKLSYVGDGQMTVELDNPKDCDAAVRAFGSNRSFEWTARQIGLDPKVCVPRGRV